MTGLKELRAARGLTQEECARKLGVSRQTYAHYEATPRAMTIDRVLAVCRVLDCDVGDVLGGDAQARDVMEMEVGH